MLFIRNEGNPIANLSAAEQQEHIKKVGSFISEMVNSGKMKEAQPLEHEGKMVTYRKGQFLDGPFNETKEVISGYYRITAQNMDEAIEIAKADPRFMDGEWKIEIRPIMNVKGIN